MSVLWILIVASVIFLAMLGKHGWNPFMRVLLVLALVPLALLIAYQSAYREHRLLQEERGATTATREGLVLVAQPGQVEVAGLGGGRAVAPPHSRVLAPSPASGVFDLQAQVRPPVRGRWTVLSLLVLFSLAGLVAFHLMRRGPRLSWRRPAAMKVAMITVGICLALVIIRGWAGRAEMREALVAVRKATEIERTHRQEHGAEPRSAAAATPESPAEPERFRDVDVWRRESVLNFVPLYVQGMPSWCREGLETEPEVVRFQNTKLVSTLPDGRTWIAGYSSQNPDLEAAQDEALAAAHRKLATAALLHVKRAVPELDVRLLEDTAAWLAGPLGRPDSTYRERATLEREGRPYGTVYRAAVRVRADPSIIDLLSRRICSHVDSFGAGPQPDLQVAFFSGMILAVLAFSAFLVYVFIRAGASGPWVYLLRLVSGGMLATIVAAVIYVSVSVNLGGS